MGHSLPNSPSTMIYSICLLLLVSIVSGCYEVPQVLAVQKVGLAPSTHDVFMSGHMGPALLVSLPSYDYTAHQTPMAVHQGPAVLDQSMVEHAPMISQMKRDPRIAAPVQYLPSMIHSGVVQHPQPAIHFAPQYPRQPLIQYSHGTQPFSSVAAHKGGHHHDKDSHVKTKSVEYELLEDLVSSDKKSRMTHKTSYHASSNPVEYGRFEDSAYASASSSSHDEEEDDYVHEEVHDAPAMMHHSVMMQPASANHSPVMARAPASNNGQMVFDRTAQLASPMLHNEIVQHGSVRYLGGEERAKRRMSTNSN